MAKKRIHVIKPFMLIVRGTNGKPHYHKFPVGIHYVDEELADHSYTQNHIAHSKTEGKRADEKRMDEAVQVTKHEAEELPPDVKEAEEHAPEEEVEETEEEAEEEQPEEEEEPNQPARKSRRSK